MFLVNFYTQETQFFFLFILTSSPLLWPFLTSLEHLRVDSGASIPHHTGSLQLTGAVRSRETGRGWLLDWCSINSDVRTCSMSWWLGPSLWTSWAQMRSQGQSSHWEGARVHDHCVECYFRLWFGCVWEAVQWECGGHNWEWVTLENAVSHIWALDPDKRLLRWNCLKEESGILALPFETDF